MLDDNAFRRYARRLGLSKAAVAALERARSSPPLALPTFGRGSTPGRWASRKMGHTAGTDARSTEFLACAAYDFDDAVAEYWEQAITLVVQYLDKAGKTRGLRSRLDFLVLERDGVYLDSWKTEEELLELVVTMPGLYQRAEGGWRSPAFEAAAAQIGLEFRLRTPATVRAEVAQNGTFLAGYWNSKQPVPDESVGQLVDLIDERPGITLAEILRSCPEVPADHLYLLIARGELFVDLARHRLADTFYTPVFRSRAVAEAILGSDAAGSALRNETAGLLVPGNRVEMGGRVLLVVGLSDLSVRFRAEGGGLLELGREDAARRVAAGELAALGTEARRAEASQRLRRAKPEKMSEAVRKTEIVRLYLAGQAVDVPPRTLRRWVAKYREELVRSGMPVLGNVPAPRGRPAGSALGEQLDALIAQAIEEIYEVADPPTLAFLAGEIEARANEAGLTPPCGATVRDRVHKRDRYRAVRRMLGSKAGYQEKEAVYYLSYDTPRHGDRPWERGHLDHTQIDLECVDSETGLTLGRPWLTLLIDEYSRRVLAYWLTFDDPSTVSVMMTLRRCVQRFGRLPENLVVDDGAEFSGRWFEDFLAGQGIHKLTRRGDPRSGAVLERLFGSLNTRLWHRLRGQTRPTKLVRAMSPEVDPRRRAVWTLAAIIPVLDWFLFDLYDTTNHPAFGDTPRNVFAARLALTGERTDSLVAYDQDFYFLTLPTTDKGTATVSSTKGVWIRGRWYKCPEFRVGGVDKSHVPVRWDPMDARRAWAHVLGRWVELYCPSLRHFPQLSEREVAALSAEYGARRRKSAQAKQADNAAFADFHRRLKAGEPALLDARRDAEARAAGLTSEPPLPAVPVIAPVPPLASPPDEAGLIETGSTASVAAPGALEPASDTTPARDTRRAPAAGPDTELYGTY